MILGVVRTPSQSKNILDLGFFRSLCVILYPQDVNQSRESDYPQYIIHQTGSHIRARQMQHCLDPTFRLSEACKLETAILG
jgi:hypothetical protein